MKTKEDIVRELTVLLKRIQKEEITKTPILEERCTEIVNSIIELCTGIVRKELINAFQQHNDNRHRTNTSPI